MIASLPMYLPGDGVAQALWSALAGLLQQQGLADVPLALSRPADLHAHWLEPDVLLSQTCGYPLTTALHGKVQLVGSFAYDVPGASGIQCSSQLIRRKTDARTTLAAFAGSTLAYNSTDSQSGFNALRALVATSQSIRPFFARGIASGGHHASIELVRTGRADMAAIDCVTLAIWQAANPTPATEIAVFAQTAPYPGLPLVTALQTPPQTLAALRSALSVVATDARFAAVRAPLHITGFEVTTLDDYAVCQTMEKAGSPLFPEASARVYA